MSNAGTSRRGRRTAGDPVEITTFPQAVRYLYDRTNVERMRLVRVDTSLFKLDRMRSLLEAIGNPQEQVRMVHVAGTVGKGSTVSMIGSMLRGCNYAVGEYTSPHLVDLRERIRINDEMISRSDFTDLARMVADAGEHAGLEDVTFFEMMTAIAYKHFADQAVDLAVIEVGLGGRLDSTNVITPEVSVVTKIDYDHTQLLGRTLQEIAREKAGIFKRGVPAFTVEQDPVVEEVFREVAEKAEAPLRIINKDIEFSSRFGMSPDIGPHMRICLLTETSQFMHLPVPMPGEHQAGNCALALAVVDALKGVGFVIDEVQMLDGLSATKVPGRMELVWDQPRILIDGAHNAASISALVRCVGAYVPYDSMVCVFGCCEDKNIRAMLENIALGGDKVIFTRAKGNPRAADPEDLQREFADVSGKMSQVAPTLPEALDLASRAVGRDDLICVTGSFYLAGQTRKYLEELEKKRSSAH